MEQLFSTDDVIYSYSRAQAIEDGILVDVSNQALEAGFKVPVAMTRAAYADCVEWNDETKKRKPRTCQDENGRLWDVLYMASLAACKAGHKDRILYELYRVPVHGCGVKSRLVKLALQIGLGDNHEPVITISFPDED